MVVFFNEADDLVIEDGSFSVVALKVGRFRLKAIESAPVAGCPEVALAVAVHDGDGLSAYGLRAEAVEGLLVGLFTEQAARVRRCPKPSIGGFLHTDEGRHGTDSSIAMEIVSGTRIARQSPRREDIDVAAASAEDAVHLVAQYGVWLCFGIDVGTDVARLHVQDTDAVVARTYPQVVAVEHECLDFEVEAVGLAFRNLPTFVVAQIEAVIGTYPEIYLRGATECTHRVSALIGILVGQGNEGKSLLLDDDTVESARVGEHHQRAVGIPHQRVHHVVGQLDA